MNNKNYREKGLVDQRDGNVSNRRMAEKRDNAADEKQNKCNGFI
jgi:hypothetical protein